jgi:hypothetical protein
VTSRFNAFVNCVRSILSGAKNDEGITANDILMAQVAIALGQRRRDPANNGPRDRDYAYIAVIADTRYVFLGNFALRAAHGKAEPCVYLSSKAKKPTENCIAQSAHQELLLYVSSLPCMSFARRGRTQGVKRADKHWGNHATDLGVFIPWTMLVKGADVLAVTRVIRQCIKSELELLKAGYEQYEKHRLDCAKNKMLFCWNSWYRAGSEMCGADFGGRLTEFEWLNTYHHMGAEVALVNTSLAMMGHQGLYT